MKITLENTGRRFNKEWIFRNVNQTFSNNEFVSVLGANGSGKSTFLQLISGFLIPSEGKVIYENEKLIEVDEIYKSISIASPSLELFEELTLQETIDFHFKLKKIGDGLKTNQLPELMQLKGNEKKQLKYFSSGMKQRVKLALAILSDTSILLLDEPTSNLDRNGIDWYKNIIDQHKNNRIVFVASNKVEDDYFFCNRKMEIENYK